jgi:hypothetical protein
MPLPLIPSLKTIALTMFLAAAPGLAVAHSFGRLYTLPLPFWLYAWGAMAALVLSFVAVSLLPSVPESTPKPAAAPRAPARSYRLPATLLLAVRLAALGCLAVCIVTGFWGHADAYANVNMTLFWIVFVLAFAWACALTGDWYALVNPWHNLALALQKWLPRYGQGIWRGPEAMLDWLAFFLYCGFITLELLGRTTPLLLAQVLLGYTLFNLWMAGVFGLERWFNRGEFFAVFFRLISLMAPLLVQRHADGVVRLHWRLPFSGLHGSSARSWGELLFVLFMLASTAFDGLRETKLWVGLYWTDFYAAHREYFGQNPFAAFPKLQALYFWWQAAAIWLCAWLYLGVYCLGMGLSRLAAQSRMGFKDFCLRFAYSLLPIALVYHVTHYWTLLLTQGLKIFPLASDPFGTGADYLGTAGWFQRAIIPDMDWVWHAQVGLIVLGHVISVVVAHQVAVRLLGARAAAIWSQLPMLLLMLALTTIGLWVLSQPLQS